MSRKRPKARIVHITTVHSADDVRIRLKECRSLLAAGFDVHLIAVAGGTDFADGVTSHLIAPARGRLRRMVRSVFGTLGLALAAHGDVYQLHDPELIPLGVMLKLGGRRVVYDAHESVPDQIRSKEWIPSSLRPLVAAVVGVLESAVEHLFDGIVAATPAIASRFSLGRTVVVQNFPIPEELTLPAETAPYAARDIAVVYIGGIARGRGLAEMVEVARRLRSGANPVVHVAGRPASAEDAALLEVAVREGVVRDHGWLPREGIAQLLGRARTGLVALHPLPNHVESYPVKMFEYMAAGIPVVASDFPLWREVVEGARCGVLVDPRDSDAISAAIRGLLNEPELAAEMGRNGQRAVHTHYQWDYEARRLIRFYMSMLAEVGPDVGEISAHP